MSERKEPEQERSAEPMTGEVLPALMPTEITGLRLLPKFDGVFTSLDPSNGWQLNLILRAMQSSDYAADEIEGKPYKMVHVLIRPSEFVDEQTGKLRECPRVNLIGPNGEIASIVSPWVLNSLRIITRLYGVPPYDPPLTVRLKTQKTRSGRGMLILEAEGQARE